MNDTPAPEQQSAAQSVDPAALSVEQVRLALRKVKDPELNLNIVDLGLLYGLKYSDDDGALLIDMTLTTAACPLTDVLEEQVHLPDLAHLRLDDLVREPAHPGIADA